MKRMIGWVVFLQLAVGVFAAEFYVCRQGNDANPGTSESPFATLSRARDAIRELKQAGALTDGVTVIVREGMYALSETLALTEEDSGTETAPIVYRAAPGQKADLLGGKPITGFVPYKGKILKADLSTQGFGQAEIRVLVFDGKRQELARWPNHNPNDINGGDWAYVDGKRVDMYHQMPEDEDDYYKTHQHLDFWQRNLPRLTRTLTMKAEDKRPWQSLSGGQVSVFPRFNWWHYVLDIKSFDAQSRTLILGPGCFYEIRPGDRYFIRGVKEELDSPGEWYYDRAEQTLYFWPPEPLENKAVYGSTLKTVIQLTGCSYVAFEGFTIECSESTAIKMNDCSYCTIAANTIRNAGDAPDLIHYISHFEGSGISIEGGSNNRIIGNDISFIGGYGIYLDGGDKITLTLGNNIAENNYIHHVGLVDRKAKGIEVLGAGNHVRHNLIHDIPQSGIYIWGSKHTVEYNHIRHTCLEAEDTGAIGGGNIDWLGWHGLTIRYNYIHDTIGFGFDQETGKWSSPHFVWALYPDWAPSGVEIFGNILVRAPRELIHLHCGRHNRVENNILVDGGDGQIYWSGWTTATGFWSTMVDGWTENYKKAIQHDAWKQVPTMVDPATVPLPDGQLMYDNVFSRNIIYYRKDGAMLYHLRQLPLEKNPFDHNVLYHFGKPFLTGQFELKGEKGDNLLANPGLEDGPVGQLPKGWPSVDDAGGKVRIEVAAGNAHSGQNALRIDPGPQAEDAKVVRMVYLPLSPAPYTPGKAYRLQGWIKTETDTPATVEIFSHTWKVMQTVLVNQEYRRFDFVFRIPKEGQTHYDPTKKEFNCMLVFRAGTGPFWLDEVCLREAELLDEWQSWKAMGQDAHSLEADPLFVDAENDDYRLKPESPAFKLGFKPIPVEKIGLYKDPLRASWPVVEARGAREAMKQQGKIKN